MPGRRGHFRGWRRFRGRDGKDEIFPRTHPGDQITVFIGVPSIEEYAGRVERAGGRVVVPKRAVPGRGYFAVCEDTEGNRLGLWEEGEKRRKSAATAGPAVLTKFRPNLQVEVPADISKSRSEVARRSLEFS